LPRSGDAVEDDGGEGDIGAVAGEAAHQRRDRAALAAGVDDEDDGPAGQRREIGGRAESGGTGAVEQPHDALAQHEIGAALEIADQRRERCAAHRPGIEIDAGRAHGGAVKRRIDVIRPGLRRRDPHAPGREVAQQPQGQHGLAAARCRCRENEPAHSFLAIAAAICAASLSLPKCAR
jgi:hypothetical protein